MNYDEDSAHAKRAQLLGALGPTGKMLPEDLRHQVVDAFAKITPPERSEGEFNIGLITINSLYEAPKASSRKPGNVVLNWKKLLDIVPDISLAGLGAATLPVSPQVAFVLAGLYIWNKVWRGAVEEFSDVEATVILALWEHKNDRNRIHESEGFARTNEVRSRYELESLTLNQYTAAVNRLASLECIELEDGIIWLREWVRKKYS